jgi:transcription termination/antitermination protein NusA
VELGRIAAQSAKQVILQKVREAERDRQFEEFKDRVGTIINGVVKREEYGNVIVDIGRGEGILRRNEKIGREAYRIGDRIRCFIKDVRREARGPQVFLSRAPRRNSWPNCSRWKCRKSTTASSRSRPWPATPAAAPRSPSSAMTAHRPGRRLRRHARQPRAGRGERVAGRKDRHHPVERGSGDLPRERAAARRGVQGRHRRGGRRIEVVVPDEQLSLAIGRRGQNVRLASQLTGLDIDIMTEAEESARRQAEFAERTKLFMDTLDLDELMAQLLVAEGFTNLEEVAYVDLDELLSIDGFDEGTARNFRPAPAIIWKRRRRPLETRAALGVEDSLIEFEGLTPQMIEALAKDGIKTLEDFATCADWELAGGWTTVDGERVKDDGLLEPFDMSLEEAQHLIMTARVMLGWVDPSELEGEAEGGRRRTTGGKRTDAPGDPPMTRGGRGRDGRTGTALHRHGRAQPKGGSDPLCDRGPTGRLCRMWPAKLPGGASGCRRPRGAGQGGEEGPVRPRP